MDGPRLLKILFFEGLSGLNAIYPCMMTHEPLDLVIIMLGTIE